MNAQPTALVVDDDAESRQLLARVLERNGWHVLEAGDGPAALEAAGRASLDLIVLDLRMPGPFDGLRTASLLRQNPVYQRVPILGVSANPQDTYRHRALAAGCAVFLSKPVNLREFLTQVDRLTGRGDTL